MTWRLSALLAALVALSSNAASDQAPAGLPGSHAIPGSDLFTNGAVHQLRIEIAPEDLARLRQDSREYVRATVREAAACYQDVAVHLKGSIGSFRSVDDKPAFTLDFNRFNALQKFHQLRRIHLNNSVEDPSYCNELLGGELFRASGVPAPRVCHAMVSLNGRRLGLYVLKEGFTEDFLAGYFNQVGGNLYEPGEGHDVNQRLKRNSVLAPKAGRGPLEALAEAALEADPDRRWDRLQQTLEVDRFVSFMAMEVMLGHRDGYCLARNNYRVYENLDTGRMVFFPHGMDQLFGNPDASWRSHMAGLVAQAVIETGRGKRLYEERFVSLFTNLFKVQELTSRVEQVVNGLRPWLTEHELDDVRGAALALEKQIAQRQVRLTQMISEPELTQMIFTNGIGRLAGWRKADEPPAGTMEETRSPDKLRTLHIFTHSAAAASWQAKALLGQGRYRFSGRVKVSGVKALPSGQHQGAGLRIAGGLRSSANLIGDSDWTPLAHEFEITSETQAVEFICELRASSGEAWFDLESLQVLQIH